MTHTVHVKYDAATRRYVGLPPELAAHLQQQFGLPLLQVDRVAVAGYASRIPLVLVQLRELLLQQGGLEVEGPFRVAADGDEVVQVKRAINAGLWSGCRDIHVAAQLIKLWLREMPPPRLLDGVDPALISAADSEEAAGAVVQRVGEPLLSLLLWLLDLCCAVCSRSAVNKMGAKALGIVISPNLFTPDTDDPLRALQYSHRVAAFLQRAIQWRSSHDPQRQQQPPPR